MIEIKTATVNTGRNLVNNNFKREKRQEKAIQPESVTSYDNTNANTAIRNNLCIFQKKEFVPAVTKEELETQIRGIEWADEKDIKRAISSLKKINEYDIPLYSEFFNKLNSLSDDLKSSVKLDYYLSSFKTSDYKNNLKNFSPETLNKLNPEIQKKYANTITHSILYGLMKDSDGINRLYETLNNKYRDNIFEKTVTIYYSSKEQNKEFIKKAESLNNLNEQTATNISNYNIVIINSYTSKQVKSLVEYINQQVNNGNVISEYDTNDLFTKNYSYSIGCKDNTPVAGTTEFKPFHTKEQLKTELASMKKGNGMFMFTNEQINKIINNENDITELSKILDKVKKANVELSGYEYEQLLMSEGITLASIENQLEFLKKVNEDKSFKNIRDIVNNNKLSIIQSTDKELEKIEDNTGLIEILQEVCPDEFQNAYNTTLINILKTAVVKPENFKKLINYDLYPNKLNLYQCNSILQNDTFNNINKTNIDFLTALKQERRLSFLYDKKGYCSISNYDITNILTRNIPDNFNLQNKNEIIDFLAELHSDQQKPILQTSIDYINILLKDTNDNPDDGRRIVEFLKRHNMIDCNSGIYLTNKSFSETIALLEKFEDNPYITSYKFICNQDYSAEDYNKYFEIINYAQSFDSMKTGITLDSENIFSMIKQKHEVGLDSFDVENIKAEIAKLDAISQSISPELWNSIKEKSLRNIIEYFPTSQYNFKKGNLDYFSEFAANERTTALFDAEYINYIDLLQKDLNISSLEANKGKMYNFAEKYCNKDFQGMHNIYIDKNALITFDGNYDLLENKIQELIKNSKDKTIYINFDEKNNITIENNDDNITEIYDKNLNLLSQSTTKQEKDEFGNKIYKIHITDKVLHIEHDIVSTDDPKDPNYKIPLEITSQYYDNNHQLIKTKSYEYSNIDGVSIIKEKYPSGEVKILSDYNQSDEALRINKELESPEGVKTTVNYIKESNGNEDYSYLITDKDGNVLTNLHRSTEYTDENTKITKVNDKTYKVVSTGTNISVYDFQTGNTTEINLKEINPENAVFLNDMLKTLSGDELINLKENVKQLSLTNRIDSGMDQITKTMYIGPHKFVFEHELGHSKDYLLCTQEEILQAEDINNIESKIASNPELQAIFEEEKEIMRETTSKCIQDQLNYFINDTTHYGGKLGGLRETIAETNAIQNTPQYHSLLQTRTHLLQEYFPRTISYLINNNLI